MCGFKKKQAYIRSTVFVYAYMVLILSLVYGYARVSSGTSASTVCRSSCSSLFLQPCVVLLPASHSIMHILICNRSWKAPADSTVGQFTQLLWRQEVVLHQISYKLFLHCTTQRAIVLTTGSVRHRLFSAERWAFLCSMVPPVSHLWDTLSKKPFVERSEKI